MYVYRHGCRDNYLRFGKEGGAAAVDWEEEQ